MCITAFVCLEIIKMDKRLMYNWGINDVKNSSRKQYYKSWNAMICRCYSDKSLLNHSEYTNVNIYEGWKYLSNFKEWFSTANYIQGYVLDKDLYIPNSKIYSPDTCLFIPAGLNNLVNIKNVKGYKKLPSGNYFVEMRIRGKSKSLGTYKTEKEAHNVYIKEKANHIMDIADEYKHINDKIYVGLYRHASVLENGFYDF